jgi:hypothetical protein
MLICAAALVYSWLNTAHADSASIGTTAPAKSSNHKLRFHAIMNGHNLQPRDDQLKPLLVNDISQQGWEKIDRLYDNYLFRVRSLPSYRHQLSSGAH